MKHTLLTDKRNDLLSEPTLTELIDNNKLILETGISKETICNLINMITVQEKHSKYINILRALINCNNHAIVGN